MSEGVSKNKLHMLHQNRRARKLMVIGSAASLLLVMIFCVTRGNYHIPIKAVFETIASQLGIGQVSQLGTAQVIDINYPVIVCDVRLPRILLAALGGMALAMSGTAFQGVFRNPLVEPYILGVSSGAACGAALAIVYFQGLIPVSVMAFAFAIGAMLLAYTIATTRHQTSLVNLIISGLIVSSLFTAILNLLKTVAPDSKLREITFWLMGGYYNATWSDVLAMLPAVIISLLILWRLGWQLNVLSMGDQEARSMGVRVGLLKLVALGIGTFITASIVSRVGIVSWVGLMIPHASRMILGSDHRYLVPFSAFLGGCFMIICDTIARTIIMGEIPISIITSVVGAPYLIYLLRTNRQVTLG